MAKILERVGSMLVTSLPVIIRALGIIGTVAMLLVGGGMFTHNIEPLHHALLFIPGLLGDLLTGLVVGGALVLFAKLIAKIRMVKNVEK